MVKKGDILKASWGYDMTINDYVKVMSQTDKTIKVQKLGRKVINDYGMGSGRSTPTKKIEGKPFRLHKRKFKSGEEYFVGSYPFAGGSKRRGTFFLSDKKPDYFNTWD